MKTLPRIELLTLGDELLLGTKKNAHLKYVGEALASRGLTLARNTVVQDKSQEIESAFKNTWERADIVIMTGGLGTTRINNTREAVAKVLGIALEFLPEVEKKILDCLKTAGLEMDERHKRQCFKLEGSELLENKYGTAHGIWLEHQGKLLIMLPGMASEMTPMFEDAVIPRLAEKGLLQEGSAYFQVRTIGLTETQMEALLEPILKKHGGLDVGYCLHQGIIDIRLRPGKTDYDQEQLQAIGKECSTALGDNFFSYGQENLAQGIFEQLRALEKTLAIAESCTGGKLSDAFTNIPGVSKVFAGGAVVYNNEAKVSVLGVPEELIAQHGAVSAEVAVAMATEVAEKFSADYGLSVTGFAGPGGGDDNNPVGTIYIGYHSPSGVWANKVMYPGQREAVKIRAVNAALDWMRRKLKYEKVDDLISNLEH